MASSGVASTSRTSVVVRNDPIRVSLNELPSNSKDHIVRLKVVKKFAAVQNVGKARFQRVLLVDLWGHKTKLTLFGSNVDVYDAILHDDTVYDVKNITIKDDTDDYGLHSDKVMYVHDSTEMVPIPPAECATDFLPAYVRIADTRDIVSSDEVFDLVAAVVQRGSIEDIHTRSGRTVDMYKLYVMDDSCDDIVPIALWGSLAREGENINAMEDGDCVVAFHGLRTNTYRGELSFNVWYDSRVILHPHGQWVDEVVEWVGNNEELLEEKRNGLVEQVVPPQQLPTYKLSHLLGLKAIDVDPDAFYKVRARVTGFTSSSIRTTLVCGHCNKLCTSALGMKFVCQSCRRSSTCIAKMFIDFIANDSSGVLPLSIQSRPAELIVGVRAYSLHTMDPEAYEHFMKGLIPQFSTRMFSLVLVPVPFLLRNHGIVK